MKLDRGDVGRHLHGVLQVRREKVEKLRVGTRTKVSRAPIRARCKHNRLTLNDPSRVLAINTLFRASVHSPVIALPDFFPLTTFCFLPFTGAGTPLTWNVFLSCPDCKFHIRI